MNETVSFEINQSLHKEEPKWANYIKVYLLHPPLTFSQGTIFQYLADLPSQASFDAVICSNVPLGSGLSSSAALEVAFATYLEKLFDLRTLSGVTKALRCQQAEHTFGDTPCGIMDQYISAMGKKDNLLLIDCRSNEYQVTLCSPSLISPLASPVGSLWVR
jgi:galactokinase